MSSPASPLLISIPEKFPDRTVGTQIARQIRSSLALGNLRFVLDLRSAEMIDPAFLQEIESVLHAVRSGGGDIRIAGLRPHLLSELEVAGLLDRVGVHDSVSDALASFD